MKTFVEQTLLINAEQEACNLWFTEYGQHVYYDIDFDTYIVSYEGEVLYEIRSGAYYIMVEKDSFLFGHSEQQNDPREPSVRQLH